jgi:hypothetical protein
MHFGSDLVVAKKKYVLATIIIWRRSGVCSDILWQLKNWINKTCKSRKRKLEYVFRVYECVCVWERERERDGCSSPDYNNRVSFLQQNPYPSLTSQFQCQFFVSCCWKLQYRLGFFASVFSKKKSSCDNMRTICRDPFGYSHTQFNNALILQ